MHVNRKEWSGVIRRVMFRFILNIILEMQNDWFTIWQSLISHKYWVYKPAEIFWRLCPVFTIPLVEEYFHNLLNYYVHLLKSVNILTQTYLNSSVSYAFSECQFRVKSVLQYLLNPIFLFHIKYFCSCIRCIFITLNPSPTNSSWSPTTMCPNQPHVVFFYVVIIIHRVHLNCPHIHGYTAL